MGEFYFWDSCFYLVGYWGDCKCDLNYEIKNLKIKCGKLFCISWVYVFCYNICVFYKILFVIMMRGFFLVSKFGDKLLFFGGKIVV